MDLGSVKEALTAMREEFDEPRDLPKLLALAEAALRRRAAEEACGRGLEARPAVDCDPLIAELRAATEAHDAAIAALVDP